MRVKVAEEVNVVVRPGVHKVYQPGVYTAAEALVEQIEKQGKGERLPADHATADDAPEAEAEGAAE